VAGEAQLPATRLFLRETAGGIGAAKDKKAENKQFFQTTPFVFVAILSDS